MPASFRSHLSNLGYNGVICYPSFNNFVERDILPSLSNCKFVLSDKIKKKKKSLFSSKGFSESIADEIFFFFF